MDARNHELCDAAGTGMPSGNMSGRGQLLSRRRSSCGSAPTALTPTRSNGPWRPHIDPKCLRERTITTVFVRALLASATVAAGLVGGPGTGEAEADRLVLPDVAQLSDTVDGWQFTLAMTELRVDAVPNLATSPFTKEGFVTAKVVATIEGAGDRSVDTGSLVLGVQLGCQVNVSEGLDLGIDPEVDIFDFDSDSGTSLIEDPVLDFWPGLDTTLKPGTIKVIGLGAKTMKSKAATISVRDAHVQVSECGGPVTVRMFASARISTDSSDDSLNAYSAPSAL